MDPVTSIDEGRFGTEAGVVSAGSSLSDLEPAPDQPTDRHDPWDPPVDAFMLYNEREESVRAVVEELSSQGVKTHFWRRDIAPGEAWEKIEHERLRTARTVVVFLGSLGWGPTQLRLATEAQNLKKRIIPVLLGNPSSEALREVDGIFERLRYVDLRGELSTSLPMLVEAIRPGERTGQFAGLISLLVDGNEEQRSEVLGQVIRGTFLDRRGLSTRLREEIQQRFNPEQEGRFAHAVRDPKKIPSVRAWMLSALIWTDAEYIPNRQLIVKHLDASFETDRNARFWVLAGLYQRHASYLESASQICRSDPEPEVRALAHAVQRPDDPEVVSTFRTMLFSQDFESQAWPVLRLLRVLPLERLVADVCELLARSAGATPLAYDVLYALANPVMAAQAAKILQTTLGIDRVVDIVLGVAKSSDRGALRHFANVLAAFEPDQTDGAMTAAQQRVPDAVGSVRTLRRYVREFHRNQNVPESFVPGYASDAIDVQRDDLDIREDVQTLTAVMLATEVVPPLAIGLFGDWGSGKSFFMQSMKAAAKRISESAKTTTGSKFCSDVVAIEFNAWHYVDTNLWASLVAHILESLAEFVSPNETPEQQQTKLVKELDSAKEVVSQVQSDKASAEAQIEKRQTELQKLQVEREQKEVELRDLQLTDLQALLLGDPALKQDVKSALEEMGVPAALNSLSDLNQAVAEVNSLRGRITALAVGLFKAQNRWTIILLLILLLALPFLGAWIYQYFANSFVVVGTVVAQATAFVGGAVVFLRKAAGYVTTHLDRVEAAKQRVDKALADRRKAPSPQEVQLQEEIVKLKTQEEHVSSRLRAATAKVIDLEQRILSLTESRSLARFVTERTRSDDYRKHLGLISIIRQDFETLTARLQSPARAPELRRVERIILYIDDLDRCPADKVMDVLQAVHLLLAYPLFVVVVGVDPRWLSYSLTATYGAFKDAHFPSSDPDPWHTTPQNYLEKIFQIPFSLRPMTAAGYTRLVQGLFSAGYRAAPKPTQLPQPLSPRTPVSPGERDLIGQSHGGPASPLPPDLDHPVETRKETPRDPEFTIHDDALEIKPVEANFAERLYSLLPTPRATKRFANIYRILKAPILPEQLESFEGTEHAPGTFQVPMLLLAILVGMPSEAAILFPSLLDRVAKGHDPIGDLAALETLGFDKNTPAALRDKVSEIVGDSTFPRSPELFFYWLPRVSRFSFEIGRAIRPAFVAQTRS